MTDTMTIGEVANVIANDPADIAAILEWLRDLTNVGLIVPTLKKNGGGHRNLFEPTTCYVAAVLRSLTAVRLSFNRPDGLTKKAAVETVHALKCWLKKRQKLWLIIDEYGCDTCGDLVAAAYSDAIVVVNLERLFYAIDQRIETLMPIKTKGRGIRHFAATHKGS